MPELQDSSQTFSESPVSAATIRYLTNRGVEAKLLQGPKEVSFAQLVTPRAPEDADAESVKQHFKENEQRLQNLFSEGCYSELTQRSFFAIELKDSTRSVLGLLCAVQANQIQPHEAATQRLNDIIDQLQQVKYFETAVSIAQIPKSENPSAQLTPILEQATEGKAALATATDERGITQTIWKLDESANISKLIENSTLLLLDGHHRWNAAQFLTNTVLGLIFDSSECSSKAFHRHLKKVGLIELSDAIRSTFGKSLLTEFVAAKSFKEIPEPSRNQIPLWGHRPDEGWGYQFLNLPLAGDIDGDLDVVRFKRFTDEVLGRDESIDYLTDPQVDQLDQAEGSTLALMSAPSLSDLTRLRRPIEAPKATNFNQLTKLAPGFALMPCNLFER